MLAPSTRCAPIDVAAAQAAFHAAYPGFDPDGSFGELRRRDYGRLDEGGHTYLDYTGGSLHAASQIAAHAALLTRRVLGNPHSNNPTSSVATELVEEARAAVLRFFAAPPDEYLCVFTPNATGALRLVGESYPFTWGGTYALTVDNHNSVNGIREYARRRGADVVYAPIHPNDLRVDRDALHRVLDTADPTRRNLLAFPAQSNFSGVQHPLDVIDEAHDMGWDVLLDAAAFVPTNRLDVGRTRPDFVSASFYKIFGYPTGVGCLLLRREHLATLRRPWFAGGTVTAASVRADAHRLRPDAGAFEDGTVDYLNLAAVTTGLRHVERMGRDAIHHRVACLTDWLLHALDGLRHGNGGAVVQVHGPTDMAARGGTVAFLVRDRHGEVVDDRRIEALAHAAGISLRTGCFCNPGAGEVANGLGGHELSPLFAGDRPVWPDDIRRALSSGSGRTVAAVRVSFGLASTFTDAHRLVRFLHRFVDCARDEFTTDHRATAPALSGGRP